MAESFRFLERRKRRPPCGIFRINRHVHEDLPQHADIGHHPPWRLVEVELDLDATVDGGGENVAHLREDEIRIAGLEVHAASAGEAEELLDEFRGALARLDRMIEALPGLAAAFFAQIHFDQREIAEDSGEEIVEIVGDAASELTDRLHLLRLPQPFLKLALLREVLQAPDPSDQIAAPVPDGC